MKKNIFAIKAVATLFLISCNKGTPTTIVDTLSHQSSDSIDIHAIKMKL